MAATVAVCFGFSWGQGSWRIKHIDGLPLLELHWHRKCVTAAASGSRPALDNRSDSRKKGILRRRIERVLEPAR
jgi:hypothetical protein